MTDPIPTPTKWQRRWQWITDFPTTNGVLVAVLLLFAIVVLTTLTLMALGLKARIDIAVVVTLLGATNIAGITGSWQKIQKWKEAPESNVDEPPPGDPPPVVPPPANPNARPDLGVPDRGIV